MPAARQAARWWKSAPPTHQLILFAAADALTTGCLLLIKRDIIGAALFAVTVWDVGSLAVSEEPRYDAWAPTGRVARIVKGYVDVVHSIRYGRGQRILRFGVWLVTVLLGMAVLVWMIAA